MDSIAAALRFAIKHSLDEFRASKRDELAVSGVSEAFGVSRTKAGEALRILRDEGWLEEQSKKPYLIVANQAVLPPLDERTSRSISIAGEFSEGLDMFSPLIPLVSGNELEQLLEAHIQYEDSSVTGPVRDRLVVGGTHPRGFFVRVRCHQRYPWWVEVTCLALPRQHYERMEVVITRFQRSSVRPSFTTALAEVDAHVATTSRNVVRLATPPRLVQEHAAPLLSAHGLQSLDESTRLALSFGHFTKSQFDGSQSFGLVAYSVIFLDPNRVRFTVSDFAVESP